MTVEEVMQKEMFDKFDIMVLFRVKQDKAYDIIKQIRKVSDLFGIAGRVHKQDYLAYIHRFDKKEVDNEQNKKDEVPSLRNYTPRPNPTQFQNWNY